MLTARRRLIGLGLLLGAVAAAWLGIAKPNPFRQQQVVHVLFDHVQGIALVQRDVRVAGVNVGTIGAVRRVGDHAEVELLLDQHIPVYRNARAALRPHTPFEGTTFIDLDPGRPGAGTLGSSPIPLSRTTVFVSAGDVFSAFTAPIRRDFQVIVRELSRALSRPGQQGLSAAIHNAPALLRQTTLVAPALRGPHDNELRKLIPSLSSTVDALAGENGQLQSAVHDAARTLDAVAVSDAVPFDRSLAALPATLAEVAAAGQNLVGILHHADTTAGSLAGTLQQIPSTTGPLTGLFTRADPTLRTIPPVVNEFSATLANLARSSPGLGSLFGTLAPVASTLADSIVPFLNSRSRFGLPVYLQLLASVTGFTGTLSSFVNETGQLLPVTGHALRGTLQAPVTLPLGALNSPLPCSAIAALNPNAAQFAQMLGLCT
jgi:ABC-type transporter Mla subunit MlaD